jgi:hypothetical protein
MTVADLVELVGYGLGAWGVGWCAGILWYAVRRVLEAVT